ncbi:MAG: cell wall-active antibiotics response protein, partial [Bacteroidota bacterium]
GLLIMMKSFGKKNDEKTRIWSDRSEQTPDDYLDSTTAFGGVKRNIISKNFKGGEITTIFGGTDLIFTQADVNGKIVLEVTQLFGGTKLIVPPHWKVETGDLVCVFGGVDDKRPAVADGTVDQNKVLVLKGTCIFGGIDIKSY